MPVAWLRRLRRSFGGPFLLLVVSIYWTQGFRAFPWTGISYLIKDELKLSPAASQLLTSTAFIPWSIKPVYGIFSDCVRINGARRIPYLLISSVLSLIAWGVLALSRSALQSTVSFTAWLTCQNVGSAMADVVIDAMVAETTKKEREEFAGDLQTLSWLAMALGGVLGSILGGPGLKYLKPSGMFGVFTLFPIAQLAACALINENTLLARSFLADGEREEERERITGGPGRREGEEREEGREGKGTKREVEDEREVKEDSEGGGKPMELSLTAALHRKNGSLERVHFVDDANGAELCGIGENGLFRVSSGKKGKTKLQHWQDSVVNGFNGNGNEQGVANVNGYRQPSNGGEADHGKQIYVGRENYVEGERGNEGVGDSDEGARESSVRRTDERESIGKRRCSGSGRREASEVDVDGMSESVGGQNEAKTKRLWSEMKEMIITLWQAMRQPSIMRPLLWFMMSCAIVPSLQTMMFYYQTNALHLDAAFLGTARVVGWGGLMAGTLLYNAYLKRAPLRSIFLWVHVLLAICTVSDALLVLRINLRLGLPDKVWVLGASALTDAINQFKFMPFLVLSARLCPPGIEGTLFAVFMSAYNLGGTISGYLGASLAAALQVSAHSFERLSLGLAIQAACTLLPILLLFMIPKDIGGTAEQSQVKVLIEGEHEKQI